MSKWIKKKDFDKIFESINTEEKNIRVIQRIIELPKEIIDMALRLSTLDFINFIKITDYTLVASSELKGKTKEPLTTMNHPTAIGIEILYHTQYKVIDFVEINSPIKGNGSKMVEAIFTNFPKNWQASVVMDWSDGFWDKMKQKYNTIKWVI